MSQPIDIEAIRARLSEYDPDAPRCTKTVAESRNYAPDNIIHDDPEWDTYTVTHHVPCCRPEGHDGKCRNSRRVLGWPGYATLVALLDEVEDLRSKLSSPRAHLDDLLASVEQGARAVERDKIVAWLRTRKDKLGQLSTKAERLADAIERGDHLREWDQR